VRKLPIVVAALLLTGAACSSNESPTVATPPPSSAAVATPEASAPATFTGKTFSFTLKQDNDNGKFYFEPATITASKGSTATITVSNVGSVKHNLTIKSLNVAKDVDPGKSVTLTVALGNAAEVPFYCAYHKASGMTGTFKLTG
jgi:plastocyanin